MAKLGLGAANLKLKCDIALTSLTALRESSDAFPPLKSAVGGVLALWNTAERVKTSKERAQALSRRTYEILEALTDAVPDPANIHPSMLASIQRFDDVLREARDAMVPLTKRRRFMASVLSLSRDEATLELFNRRLDESFQSFTIAGLTRVETQLLAIKADATVAHQALLSLNRDEATLQVSNRRLDESFQSFTIAGLTQVETQLLAIKADATVSHRALIDTLTLRFSLTIGLF
ncbi:hypothetical protein B0H19DRAFT_1370877 [Mycena capillaripes]|nr:hypothetical protein B0H19DRAFT_1370877 [Mycena capillaripes]